MKNKVKISSITCAYNEEAKIEELLKRLLNLDYLDEIVIVDNGSIDATHEIILNTKKRYDTKNIIKIISIKKNIGLGFGLIKAIKNSTGDIVARIDGDLEYDPEDIQSVIQPILDGLADASYGSRMLIGHTHRVHYYYHYIGNRIITMLINFLTNKNFSDVATATKCVKGDLIRSLPLRANKFNIDWEITLLLANRSAVFFEVPIKYHGRKYDEGKKVKTIDGINALLYIITKFLYLKIKPNRSKN